MVEIDTGLRGALETNVTTAAAKVDSADYDHELADANEKGTVRSIGIKESAKAGAQATIDNPPLKTITDSSKKGSSSKQVVDENAVSAAKAELAQLNVEIANLESEKKQYSSDKDQAKSTQTTEKATLDEHQTKLDSLNQSDKLLNKFEDVFNGKDRFASQSEETDALNRLKGFTDKIKDWGDLNGDGVDDGKQYADSVNAFLYGEGGYLSKPREYGAMPETTTTTNSGTVVDTSGTGTVADRSGSTLRNLVLGGS